MSMPATDLLLLTGATLRLTRVVTTDAIGEKLLMDRVTAKGVKYVREHGSEPSWWWVAEGLRCPYCVGYWLGVGASASYLAARRSTAALGGWRFVAGTLALNYVIGHTSARLD